MIKKLLAIMVIIVFVAIPVSANLDEPKYTITLIIKYHDISNEEASIIISHISNLLEYTDAKEAELTFSKVN